MLIWWCWCVVSVVSVVADEVLLDDGLELAEFLFAGSGVLDEPGLAVTSSLLQDLFYNQLLYLLLYKQFPTILFYTHHVLFYIHQQSLYFLFHHHLHPLLGLGGLLLLVDLYLFIRTSYRWIRIWFAQLYLLLALVLYHDLLGEDPLLEGSWRVVFLFTLLYGVLEGLVHLVLSEIFLIDEVIQQLG